MKRFNNKRFITKGVLENINPLTQILMWQCIDKLTLPQDYLQIFDLTIEDGKQKIKHTQEEPEYHKEYLLNTDASFYVGKVFVIDDETHCTMLLAEDY